MFPLNDISCPELQRAEWERLKIKQESAELQLFQNRAVLIASSTVSQINSGLLPLLLQTWFCQTHGIYLDSPHGSLDFYLVYRSIPVASLQLTACLTCAFWQNKATLWSSSNGFTKILTVIHRSYSMQIVPQTLYTQK